MQQISAGATILQDLKASLDERSTIAMDHRDPALREPVANVYECIAAVSAEIAKTGIAKDSRNLQQGYAFRGIDAVYNALAPLLAKHKLVILPRILTRTSVERTSKSGTAQFYVTVEAEFDFVSARDGSTHTVRTFGEAQDSGDKATNKAMSAAYKYAAFQTFCIPTEGDNDADAETPEESQPTPEKVTNIARPVISRTEPSFTRPAPPPGYDDKWTDLTAAADEGTEAFDKTWAAMTGAFKQYTIEHRRVPKHALAARAAAVTKAKK